LVLTWPAARPLRAARAAARLRGERCMNIDLQHWQDIGVALG
jgi:hypothetical protein